MLRDAERLIGQIKERLKEAKIRDGAEIVICPPSIFLSRLAKPTARISYGVQNVGFAERGPYTGEISVLMAKDQGATYCIVGHSDRRIHFAETTAMFNEKIKLCLFHGITPVFCVGEFLKDKKEGRTKAIIKAQLEEGLRGVNRVDVKRVIITYEPIWAISTSKDAEPDTPDNVMGVTILIRKILLGMYDEKTARSVRIIYGGSVNPANAYDLAKNGNVEGFLIGSASLTAINFISIIKKSLN